MKFIETYKTKSLTKWVNTCSYIILHHTASAKSAKDSAVASYLANSNAVSVHYVVWKNWDIYKLCEDDKIAWHAWVSQWEWKVWMNNYSIGIEIVSDWYEYTDDQRKSVRELVTYLMEKYNINKDWIIRHRDVAPKRKRDVWDNFWNNEYKTFKEYQESFNMTQKINFPEESKKLWIWNWEEWDRAATRNEVATMLYKLYKLVNK